MMWRGGTSARRTPGCAAANVGEVYGHEGRSTRGFTFTHSHPETGFRKGRA
jgi:hypothetical protein